MDASLIVTLATVSLTWAIVYYHIKKFSFWSSRGVPGPIPWPIFGTNIYYLFGHKLEQDRKWRQQYGHTYGLYEGYLPLLRTTDNELIKKTYVKEFSSFTDRNGRYIHNEVQKNWIFWSKGTHWANQRVLMSPMFTSAKMRPMFDSMAACVDRFLVEQNNKSKPNGGKEVSPTASSIEQEASFSKVDIAFLTLDVIATCFFGLKLDTYSAAENEFLREAYNFASFELWWFLLWILTPTFAARRFGLNLFRQSRLKYFVDLTRKIVTERRRNKAQGKTDIIQAFMDAKLPASPDEYEQVFSKDDDKEAHYNDNIDHEQLEDLQRKQTSEAKYFKRFTDFEIQSQMVFLFLAGFETTATTLTFSAIELAARPDVQALLHTELKDKFKCDTDEQLAGFKFTRDNYSDLLDLKQLDCFVSEVMRMYSPILEHNRTVTEPAGVVVESPNLPKPVHLPLGTPISTNGFVLQRDQDYFEKADEFDMSRWNADNRAKIKSGTFMPFGLGPRHCAGMRFALLEVKLAIAKILAQYQVEPGSDKFQYPPKFQHNAVFLMPTNSDLRLTPRVPATIAAVA